MEPSISVRSSRSFEALRNNARSPAASHLSANCYSAFMRIFFRSLLSLALIVWLGAEIFFPVVAATTFRTLAPNTHTAGAIVGSLLRTMHLVGMVCGVVLLIVLAAGPVWGLGRPRAVQAAMALLVAMLAATACSQYGITPAMERDRLAAGGAIDSVAITHPARVHFERLHKLSVKVEGLILFFGLSTVVLVAYAETTRPR